MYQEGLVFEDELGLETKERSYRLVRIEEMREERYASSSHAAHVMIYCPTDLVALKVYNVRAYVLMQLRFDGHFGFPGGLLEPGEIPEEAIAREIEEQTGLKRQHFRLDTEDHIVSHYSEDKDLFLHLFSKEVNLQRLSSIEASAVKNNRYGDEVMGLVRVPLLTMSDGWRGFPAFLSNSFVGNSKEQLLIGIVKKGIMTEKEVQAALQARPKYIDKLNTK